MRAMQRQFAMGCQLGWFALGGSKDGRLSRSSDGVVAGVDTCGGMAVFEALATQKHTGEIAFLNELLAWKRLSWVREYLQHGHLSRPLTSTTSIATFTAPHESELHTDQPGRVVQALLLCVPDSNIGPLPAASATAWKNSNGTSLFVLLVSAVHKGSSRVRLEINMAQHGFSKAGVGFCAELWDRPSNLARWRRIVWGISLHTSSFR